MLDILTLTIDEVIGRFKAVDDEEALAAGEVVSVGGKLHYATKNYHCHVCQKEQMKGESSSFSSSSKRGTHGAPKARGGAEGVLTVYFGTPNMFITLWFGFHYGTNPPLGTLII
jgi:hypothetical protein